MTEAEAITKWCPFRNDSMDWVPADTNVEVNRCLGSDCMMWVWDADIAACTVLEIPPAGHCGLVHK